MKKGRVNLLVLNIILIITIFLLLLAMTFLNKKKQEHLLKNEINNCLNHINDDDIIKRLAVSNQKESYKIVEQSIKKYLSSVINDMNQIKNILSDAQIMNIISIENIRNNKDNLSPIKEYIKTTKYQLNQRTFRLISYLTDDGVMNFLEAKLDNYYINLYKEYVILPETVMRNNINNLKMNVDRILSYLDTCNEIIVFLENHQAFWEINSNIVFTDNNILNQYNLLLEKLK